MNLDSAHLPEELPRHADIIRRSLLDHFRQNGPKHFR